jgi:transcription antitermination factor NusG
VNYLKQRSFQEEPLRKLFQPGEMLEIVNGPFRGVSGFFEKLQTQPNGTSRAMLLIEILGSVQKLQIQLTQIKKLSP